MFYIFLYIYIHIYIYIYSVSYIYIHSVRYLTSLISGEKPNTKIQELKSSQSSLNLSMSQAER